MAHPTRKARKTKTLTNVDFAFHTALRSFLSQERKKIRALYDTLSLKFLDYNNPAAGTAWLRPPQYEALEIYVFLKEVAGNKPLYELFEDWYNKRGVFEGRLEMGVDRQNQVEMFNVLESASEDDKEAYRRAFTNLGRFQQAYPNYIFALTMGLGKTVLMATCIFYEFLLANRRPTDPCYCHNALVFAPDKTVLHSLREIQTFDKSRVVPPGYVQWLDANLRFHFLDDNGLSLQALDGSEFNIIISNTQKVILKRKQAKPKPSEKLFQDQDTRYKALTLNKGYEDIYQFEVNTDADLADNQRFMKLIRLKQLGIYVDEAHHLFGTSLAKEFGTEGEDTKKVSSLRLTINELAAQIKRKGSSVVACYNYTGTPYVQNTVLPEVVYSYGLKDAINNRFLKMVKVNSFTNIKDNTVDLVRIAVTEFLNHYGNKRYEGMLPKLAFFASSIDELQQELRPAVEEVLAELGVSSHRILVNVGDEKITTNDDLREFRNLDTAGSEKQFILLVNKGKEGWNCRSLFGVVLHREPKSKVFVLQAAMRCLRMIGEVQETARVYLSQENYAILDAELTQNFRLTVDELNSAGESDKITVEVRLVPPPVKIKLRKIQKMHRLARRENIGPVDLELRNIDAEKYKVLRGETDIRNMGNTVREVDVTYLVRQREYSELTLTAEIARYLNLSPLLVSNLLANSLEGTEKVLEAVNTYNRLLHDWVIPRLVSSIYEVKEYKDDTNEIEVDLVKEPESGFYRVKAKPELLVNYLDEAMLSFHDKSFHLDNYCFDSKPEFALFNRLIQNESVDKVWFTGMLTHGQTDFVVSYVDPDSHVVRSYYPDFLVKMKSGKYYILEVKRDDQIDTRLVQAKADYARQLASSSGMEYMMIPGKEAGTVTIA